MVEKFPAPDAARQIKHVGHVLIVDDDAALGEAISYLLEVMNLETTRTTRGAKALELLALQRFDLVLCDLAMPHMDGHELIQEVRRRGDQTPFLFLSGSGTVPDVVRLMKAGAVGFVEKPFEPATLKREILQALGASKLTVRPPSRDRMKVASVSPASPASTVSVVPPPPQLPKIEPAPAIPAAADSLPAEPETFLPHMPRVLGRYELQSIIASGGMGRVFRARDPHLDREVAVKVLRAPETREEQAQFLARFRREAVALARLRHPHIVAVHDFGVDEGSGRPYVVMELLVGEVLGDILKRDGKLPPARALGIALQMAEALAYAHGQGMVHRDVKPANVVLEAKDVVRLIDFGVAHTENSELTSGDNVLGTPSYLSPEAANARSIDWRADQFALATVLLEMLSGRRVFRGESALQTVRNVSDMPTPTFEQLGIHGAPPELEALVTRMHAKYPEGRIQEEAALVAGLREAATRGWNRETVPAPP
jgi:CheY-like chemotaxis protein/tRNA A-37 threonylcarbamoyl transferase component Bud32